MPSPDLQNWLAALVAAGFPLPPTKRHRDAIAQEIADWAVVPEASEVLALAKWCREHLRDQGPEGRALVWPPEVATCGAQFTRRYHDLRAAKVAWDYRPPAPTQSPAVERVLTPEEKAYLARLEAMTPEERDAHWKHLHEELMRSIGKAHANNAPTRKPSKAQRHRELTEQEIEARRRTKDSLVDAGEAIKRTRENR